MKRRKLIRRKDGVRQHYHVGRKGKRKKEFYKNAWEQAKIAGGDDFTVEPDQVLGDPALTQKVFGLKRIRKGKTHTSHLARVKGDGLTKAELNMYINIVKAARRKGYQIPRVNLNKGPVVIDEVNILEDANTEAWTVPSTRDIDNKQVYSVQIDDDASLLDKQKAFAHELAHIHLFETGQRHTEPKADTIGADILGLSRRDVELTEHRLHLIAKEDKKWGKRG